MEGQLGQREALERAKAAAAAGDPNGMVEALAQSFILDGLVARIDKKWEHLDRDDCHSAVGEAVDSLYATVQRGQKIYSVASYLWKVADRSAFDLDKGKRRMVPTETGALEGVMPSKCLSPLDELEVREVPSVEEADRRAEGITQLRRLMPRCGGPNVQSILHYILDALEFGRADVPNEELEEATGLSSQAVRTARSRGLRRLERHAREWALGAAALTEVDLAEDEGGDEGEEVPERP